MNEAELLSRTKYLNPALKWSLRLANRPVWGIPRVLLKMPLRAVCFVYELHILVLRS